MRIQEMDAKLLGSRLRYCRKRNHYTQKYVSRVTGINPETIGRCENGESQIFLKNIYKLATLYGVSIDWLVSLDPIVDNSYMQDQEEVDFYYETK